MQEAIAWICCDAVFMQLTRSKFCDASWALSCRRNAAAAPCEGAPATALAVLPELINGEGGAV
jgi:hypothetical protein